MKEKAFGQQIAESPKIPGFKMHAKLQTQLKLNRVFMKECLKLLAEGRLDAATALNGKIRHASEAQCHMADECLHQLFGGYFYMKEYPIATVTYVDVRIQKRFMVAHQK